MRASGRAWTAAATLLFRYLATNLAAASDYGIPIEIKLWDTGRTPLAHMVDVTNGFGLKVLAEHNFLNDNNIAFSPYGLMGILVALYEGVDGECSYQIQRGMQLPWNRNVMRIGFRDIHRTLKTYFVPEEGFLAGLALNNENVTFNDSYKKILRFYGFDLDNDQLPTLAPSNSTNETSTMSSATAMSNSGGDSTTVAMTESTSAREETSSTPTREETTENPNAETIPSSASNAESTTTASTASELEATTQSTETTQTQTTLTDTTAVTETTTAVTETTTAVTQTTTPTSTSVTETALPTTAALTDEPTSNNEIDTSTTPDSTTFSTTDTTAMTDTSMMTSTDISTLITDTTQTEESTPAADQTKADSTTTATDTTLETLERRKKSLVDFIYTNPPYVDDYLILKSYDIPTSIGSDVPNFDHTNFLANGLRNIQVSYMRYDTVLEYAYLPHLEAAALRLPLDSDRYYLLVVLPTRPGASELSRLLSRMARESDLSDVYAALRPTRVRAIVPSFTVKGHVTLTTDLQKLGIRDVFEPRQRDFTPMTRQTGVYVRSIEQAVSVAIRKYQPDDQKKNRYVTSRHPVYFSATYPFLYFVMDSTINVALMAGKMVDPLNSRIL